MSVYNTPLYSCVIAAKGEGVVVEAEDNLNYINDNSPTPDSLVISDVTVPSPVTTAKNPLAVLTESVWSLIVMVVPVTVPGVEPQ